MVAPSIGLVRTFQLLSTAEQPTMIRAKTLPSYQPLVGYLAELQRRRASGNFLTEAATPLRRYRRSAGMRIPSAMPNQMSLTNRVASAVDLSLPSVPLTYLSSASHHERHAAWILHIT